MRIESGRWRANDGGKHNLQLVANMLCEIVGFRFPFPRIFEDAELSLDDETPQEMANTHRDSLAVGSSSGPREAPLPLETISTTKDSDLSDPEEAAANLPLMPPLETILPRPTMSDTIAAQNYFKKAKSLPPDPLGVGSVEAEAHVSLPSDSLAVGSRALNSESDNRSPNPPPPPPPPSRRPNPQPGMSDERIA